MGRVEEEEDEGPIIYRRRRRALSVQPSQRPVRSWVVADDDDDDDELINKNRSVFIKIDPPDVLDCPICLHPLFTPVFQCDNGHIACSSCCSKLKTKCPFCCTPIGINNDNRCRGLEKFIQSITRISCKYAKYGCKNTMPYCDKTRHEQTCPHATCNCPHPSCSFTASYKHLYLHFHIQHAPSTTRFTCNTTFSLGVEINQKRIFLQEQHSNVIFILSHEVKQDGGRAFSIDYLGPPTSKSCFVYQLTAKRMKTSLSLQSEPGIYTEWSSTDTHKRNYLTIPSDFEGYSGLLSLSVCIRKCISSPFEVEAEEETTEEVFGNEDNNDIANGALQVVLADPGVLDCSICHEPLCTPVFQCQNGHLACCLCCSKVETICPICYPLGYKYTRCRGLEVAIESIGRILCINETLAAAYSNKKSEHEQMRPPHSFQEDDDELIPIQDVEPDLLISEEEEDEDKLELMGKNQQQHMACSLPTTNIEVVLFYSNVLDCMICSNLLSPPVFQ
ncbi:aminotransferase-like mobile domain-containing protein, partial [Tanacetum coccineum]